MMSALGQRSLVELYPPISSRRFDGANTVTQFRDIVEQNDKQFKNEVRRLKQTRAQRKFRQLVAQIATEQQQRNTMKYASMNQTPEYSARGKMTTLKKIESTNTVPKGKDIYSPILKKQRDNMEYLDERSGQDASAAKDSIQRPSILIKHRQISLTNKSSSDEHSNNEFASMQRSRASLAPGKQPNRVSFSPISRKNSHNDEQHRHESK